MDALRDVVHLLVSLDFTAFAIAFGAGIVIAPLVILLRSTCWWKRRLKWAAVAMFTSWFGLWLFLRNEKRPRSGS